MSDEIELRSTSGSLQFSAARTRAQIADSSCRRRRPASRCCVWCGPPTSRPPPGSTPRWCCTCAPDIDGAALLGGFADEAVDLLLELPALETITIGDRTLRRTARDLDGGLTEITVGENTLVAVRHRHRALAGSGGRRPRPPRRRGRAARAHPVRRGLSLPALLIADVPMQPDRRRLLPGVPLARVALGYARFVAALPGDQRLDLVPLPGFARSETDAALREAVLADLRTQPWLPPAETGSDVPDLVPARASVLSGLTRELADALAEVVPGLVDPELSGPRHAAALAAVDVHRFGLARVAELLGGHSREPSWWHAVYAALEPLVVDALAVEELAAVPVPLADGRTSPAAHRRHRHRSGARARRCGVGAGTGYAWCTRTPPHPLLNRLGAQRATAGDLLSDPALHARIEDLDYDHPGAATELASAVLALVDAHRARVAADLAG